MSYRSRKTEVWRNVKGEIDCPGDSCPKDCDDSCPIYLNTLAAEFIRIGRDKQAIPLYEKALEIAPDFYDAWNNLGGIYGKMGNYQKAYDSYCQARIYNNNKPNPVYGLMMATRDLGKYDECLRWCDIYAKLSNNGAEKSIRAEVQKRMGVKTQTSVKAESQVQKPQSQSNKSESHPENFESHSDNSKPEIVRWSKDRSYVLVKYKEDYFFGANSGGNQTLVNTPGHNPLSTSYVDLANRILDDLQKFGERNMSAESILPWHYTMVDNFSKMSNQDILDTFEKCFFGRRDEFYEINRNDETWVSVFGKKETRTDDIRAWAKKCTNMQLTAVCCIGNAYRSLNLAYVLAALMENANGDELQQRFSALAKMISENTGLSENELNKDFHTFKLYYGIHLIENGNKVCNDTIGKKLVCKQSGFVNQLNQILGSVDEVYTTNHLTKYDVDMFFDSTRLCDEIIVFCKERYKSTDKLPGEFFITSFFAAIDLGIHHINDTESFTKESAFSFLIAKCDVEFTDVYAHKLLGYQLFSEESEALWDIINDYGMKLKKLFDSTPDYSKKDLYPAMKSVLAIGISVAYKYFRNIKNPIL